MMDQASKSKNSADLVGELRRLEKENLEEFLEHLHNFSDVCLAVSDVQFHHVTDL